MENVNTNFFEEPNLCLDTAQEQKLEGDFRYTHSRVIAHSEEISFYGGHAREHQVANASFDLIANHGEKVYKLHFFNGIFDSVFVKYLATVICFMGFSLNNQ